MNLPHSAQSTTVPSDLPPAENKIFYPALDGLRAVSVLVVFLQHYVLSSQPPCAQWGWTGVDMFFVLSGFLITGILFDTRDDTHRYRNFYGRRTLRIFPLYYGFFLFLLLTKPVLHWHLNSHQILWPLYLGNYAHIPLPPSFTPVATQIEAFSLGHFHFLLFLGHFWSLCVEEQFYVVWPFVVYLVRDRVKLLRICLGAVVLIPLLRLLAQSLLPKPLLALEIIYRATPLRADALLIGAALALLFRGPNAARVRASGGPLLAGASLLFAATFAVSVLYLHQPLSGLPSTPWIATLGFTLIDLAAAGLLLLTLQPGTKLYRLFCLKPLRRLGQISYGFYFFHDIPHMFYLAMAQHMIGPTVKPPILLTALIGFAATLVLALLSFRFYEAPFLRLKTYFTD